MTREDLMAVAQDPQKAMALLGGLEALGACTPASTPRTLIESIRSLLYEARTLTPDDYRAVGVAMKARLGVGTLNGSANYKVPNTYAFLVFAIAPIVALADPYSETKDLTSVADATKGFGNAVTVRDRILLKANNCQATLQNADRQLPVFDNAEQDGVNLGSLMGDGAEIDLLTAPHIVPAGENLKLTVALTRGALANDAPLLGGLTDYGLFIKGILVRTKRQ
jgi:hypothetical protein